VFWLWKIDDEMAAVVADMLERLGHRGLRVSRVPAAVAVLSGSEAVDLICADVLLSRVAAGSTLPVRRSGGSCGCGSC
jgi:CheY-like chemotaxis protein